MNFLKYLKDRLYIIISTIIIITLVIFIITLDRGIYNIKVNIESIIYAYIIGISILFISFGINYYTKKKENSKILNNILENNDIDFIYSKIFKLNEEDTIYRSLLLKLNDNYNVKLKKYEDIDKINKDFDLLWIHQMKTPISVIKLLLDGEINEKNKISISEEVEKISNGLNLRLYNQRINDFESDFKIGNINLSSIIGEVIQENKNTFIINRIYPKVEIDEDIYINSDEKWIKFTLSQIIQNALKYTKVKNIDNKMIEIYTEKKGDSVVLHIKDNGVGIAKKDLNRLYNPFFTGENGRKYSESTGMGLYLVNIVLNKLGHRLNIDSIENEYTEVRIEFLSEKNIYKF